MCKRTITGNDNVPAIDAICAHTHTILNYCLCGGVTLNRTTVISNEFALNAYMYVWMYAMSTQQFNPSLCGASIEFTKSKQSHFHRCHLK